MAPRELVPGAVPLSAVPGLSPAQQRALAGLWINSAQELVGIYGTSEPVRARLATALDINRPALDPIVNAAQRLIPLTRDASSAALLLETLQPEYALGAVLDDPAAAAARAASLPPYAPSRAPLPESVSLIEKLPPLRQQGRRGACVAFAALAVREGLEAAAGAPPDLDLSEQYVYWWCKQRDGLLGRAGTYLSLGMRCLHAGGAPLESLWPYCPEQMSSEDQGPPPEGVAGGDPAFRTAETQELSRLDLPGIKTCLAEGRPVAFSLPVFDSWFKSSAMKRWGKITMPLAGEQPREGHALALVGYQDDKAAPGGGYFLVRNSWQPWAWEGTWAEGYGYIPYAYVAAHANAIFSARRIDGAAVGVRDRGGMVTTELVRNSPDVWLRRLPDGGLTAQTPLPGGSGAIYARVTNSGPACAYRVAVDLFYRDANAEIIAIGALEAAILAPGETVLGPLLWTPPSAGSGAATPGGTGPFEFLARVKAGP